MKVLPALDVAVITGEARALNYNRVLTDEVIKSLDPNGLSVLEQVMLHKHAQGAPVEPHYRCRIMLKVRLQKEPVIAYIDVPIATYNKLQAAIPASAEVEAMQ